MTTDTPDTCPDTTAGQPERTAADTSAHSRAEWLRFIPPVSALATAALTQVAVITDTVGGALAPAYGQWVYALAALLGVAVASCAEGGAAYLMDLYDRHLVAGDSVWMLRLTMTGYVAASGWVIHWWTTRHHLPAEISWLLAGMSASALYLWSRGSRWRRREVMRAKKLIDPAMPRLSVAAKVFHPIRTLVVWRLISWTPAQTPAEARERYDEWKARRTGVTVTASPTAQARPDSPSEPESDTAPVRRERPATVRPARVVALPTGRRAVSAQPSVDDLADTLALHHGREIVGKPKALDTLRKVYGSCSADRAIAAKDLHNRRVREAGADDEERVPVAVTA